MNNNIITTAAVTATENADYINYIDREENPIQFIWDDMEMCGNAPIQADREAIRPLKDRDWMVLRYSAMELLSSLGDYTRDEIEEGAAICDERLYIGDFEGLELKDGYTLHSFYLNISNRVCATVLHYDEDESKEEWSYWIIF